MVHYGNTVSAHTCVKVFLECVCVCGWVVWWGLCSLCLCLFREALCDVQTHVDSGSFQTLLVTFLWQQTQQESINILSQTKNGSAALPARALLRLMDAFLSLMAHSLRLFNDFFPLIPAFIPEQAADLDFCLFYAVKACWTHFYAL